MYTVLPPVASYPSCAAQFAIQGKEHLDEPTMGTLLSKIAFFFKR